MFCIELSLKQFRFFLGFVCQKYVDSQNTKLKARGLHMGGYVYHLYAIVL